MTRLGDLVATSAAVAATSSRTAKVGALADLLAALDADEIAVAVAFLTGAPRQGRIGVAWATAATIAGTAADAAVTEIGDLDDALDRLEACTGPGSQRRRAELLADLGARLTDDEAEFVRRLLTGQLRQGALAGLMADAVARAAGRAGAARAPGRDAERRPARPPPGSRSTEGATALERVHLAVGVAIQPMLASTAADVGEALAATGPASVECKLDGVRIQAHRLGDDGAPLHAQPQRRHRPHAVGGRRAPRAAGRVRRPRRRGHGRHRGGHARTRSRTRPAPSAAARGPGPIVLDASWFDMLHVDGRDLIDEPLDARLAAMDAIAGLRRIPSVRTDDPRRRAARCSTTRSPPGTRA